MSDTKQDPKATKPQQQPSQGQPNQPGDTQKTRDKSMGGQQNQQSGQKQR